MYDEFLKTDFVRLFFLIHFFRLRYEKNGKNKGTILPFTEKNERVSYFIHEIGKIFGGKLEGRCVWYASYMLYYFHFLFTDTCTSISFVSVGLFLLFRKRSIGFGNGSVPSVQ